MTSQHVLDSPRNKLAYFGNKYDQTIFLKNTFFSDFFFGLF